MLDALTERHTLADRGGDLGEIFTIQQVRPTSSSARLGAMMHGAGFGMGWGMWLLMLAGVADEQTIVAATTTGVLLQSTDGGASWASGPAPVGQVTALSAASTPEGIQAIVVLEGTSVIATTDLGATTTTLV